MSIPNLENTLLLDCALWFSEDCREMQLRHQALDNATKAPIGEPAITALSRAYWRFGSGPDAFFIDDSVYQPVKPGDEPGGVDDYVPIGGQMLLCALVAWVLDMGLSAHTQHVMIKRLTFNAAASVRLGPKPTLYNRLYKIKKADSPAISLQTQHIEYDEKIERFIGEAA